MHTLGLILARQISPSTIVCFSYILPPFPFGACLTLSSAKVRGDHYVTMKVSIPRDVSAEERKLLEELQEKSGGKAKGGKKSGKNKGNKAS